MPGRGDEISTLGVSTELAERSTPLYRSCVRRRMTQDHFASSGWQQMLTQNHANSILIHPEENLGTHYRPVEFNQSGFGRPYWILGVPWGWVPFKSGKILVLGFLKGFPSKALVPEDSTKEFPIFY